MGRVFQILSVEDNAGDAQLLQSLFGMGELPHQLHFVTDGQAAVDFLHRRGPYAASPRPDLILLDLNIPKKEGREVLREIRAQEILRQIPVLVLSTSSNERDIADCYALGANAVLAKSIDLDELIEAIRGIEQFWFRIAKLPPLPEATP